MKTAPKWWPFIGSSLLSLVVFYPLGLRGVGLIGVIFTMTGFIYLLWFVEQVVIQLVEIKDLLKDLDHKIEDIQRTSDELQHIRKILDSTRNM